MFVVFDVVDGADDGELSERDELIMRQGDRFHVDTIIDSAKCLDKSIKKTADLNPIIAEHGFTILRSGVRFLAVKEVEKECIRCHQRLPETNGVPDL